MITLCMIVKDEEINIEKCLENAKNLVGEIVIVDTGSIDKTKEIAMKYTDKIYNYIWEGDFSKARNFALSKASNDWILVLDADEFVTMYDKNDIEKLCKDSNKVVGRIERVNYFEDKFGSKKYIDRINRFFNRKYYLYEGLIHEQLVTKDRTEYITKNIDIRVEHIGYSKEIIERTDKVKRNIDLLTEAIKKNESDSYLYYQLGKSYFMGKEYLSSYNNFKKALDIVDRFDYEYIQDLVECYGYSMINLEMFNEALELYNYEEHYENSADFNFLLALVEMNNGNFNGAVDRFLKCTKLKNGRVQGITSFLSLYNVGVIFQCLGFENEAITYFERCGDYAPARNALYNLR